MTLLTDIEIAPQGMSALRCAVCHAFITLEAEETAAAFKAVTCDECGEPCFRYEMPCAVSWEDADLLDAGMVAERLWYHATTRDNWSDAILSGKDIPWVHVGSERAAYDRARASNGVVNTAHDLYVLRIKPGTKVNPSIFIDANDWPDYVGETYLPEQRLNAADANRYLNEYECPGSISLLIDPRFLEVVEVRSLLPEMVSA